MLQRKEIKNREDREGQKGRERSSDARQHKVVK